MAAEREAGRGTRIGAVGVFDGVHAGHQRVLRAAIDWARAEGGQALAITFSTHPDSVVLDKKPDLIVSLPRRVSIIESLGFDATLLLPFDDRRARVPASSFACDFLGRGLGLTGVVVGDGFRFGHNAEGTIESLAAFGREAGFEVRPQPPVMHGDRVVSSSLIRELIREGDVATAAELLGRPFHLRGQVVLGQQRGRSFGFPTVNLAPETKLRPGIGVYATSLERDDGSIHAAVTNVGVCPTFGPGAPLTVETHVLDFDEAIYGEAVGVAFHARLRDEKRFDSVEALREQIAIDIARARKIFADDPTLTAPDRRL